MAKTAGIILIGNEILSGKVADQNALYLCREFRQLGVDVRKISVVPDEVDLIAREVSEFSRAYDWVFTSGLYDPVLRQPAFRDGLQGIRKSIRERLMAQLEAAPGATPVDSVKP